MRPSAIWSLLLLAVPAVAWAEPQASTLREAVSFEAELESGPYRASGQPNVAVHAPAGLPLTKPLHLVVFVHGLRGCLPVLMGRGPSRCESGSQSQLGWDLGKHHDDAGTQSVLVVPRLYYGKRGGQPGMFGKAGGFGAFLDELMAGPMSERLGRKLSRRDVASLTIVAHSAGYQTALAILEHGEVAKLVRAVVLLDALYGLHERYARYALAHADRGFRLIVIDLRGGKPAREGRKLEQRLVRALGRERVATASAPELAAAMSSHAFVFAEGSGPHGRLPQRHLSEVLGGLGLPRRGER